MDLKDTLLELEAKGWEALSSAGRGASFYEGVLADNALMVFPFGVLEREAALDAMRSAPPWSKYDITDSRVVNAGDYTAVLIYKVTARRTGEPTFTAWVNSTYVKHGNEWKLVLHQQSPG